MSQILVAQNDQQLRVSTIRTRKLKKIMKKMKDLLKEILGITLFF
jgi:hypothetical protein